MMAAVAAMPGNANARRNIGSVASDINASTDVVAFVLVAPSGNAYITAALQWCLAGYPRDSKFARRFDAACPQASHDAGRRPCDFEHGGALLVGELERPVLGLEKERQPAPVDGHGVVVVETPVPLRDPLDAYARKIENQCCGNNEAGQ